MQVERAPITGIWKIRSMNRALDSKGGSLHGAVATTYSLKMPPGSPQLSPASTWHSSQVINPVDDVRSPRTATTPHSANVHVKAFLT